MKRRPGDPRPPSSLSLKYSATPMLLLSTLQTETLIADQAFAAEFAFPPTGSHADVSAWRDRGSVPAEFDLEIWSNATVNLTGAELYGGTLHGHVIADIELDSVTHGSDSYEATGHALLDGDGPVTIASDDTLPAGLSATAEYWVIVVDANNFKLAASLSAAMAGTPVAITSNGVGTITLSDVEPDTGIVGTQRLHWHSEGLLGVLGDGAVALTVQKAYRTRRSHRPRALFYALVATLSASDPEWVSAAIYPIRDA